MSSVRMENVGLSASRTPAEEFVRAVEEQLLHGVSAIWQSEVDQYLSNLSWDKTWREMRLLMDQQLTLKTGALPSDRVGAAHV